MITLLMALTFVTLGFVLGCITMLFVAFVQFRHERDREKGIRDDLKRI